MTSVPKPLKFLRPHYEPLCELYEQWKDGEEKVFIIYYIYIILLL